MDDHFPQAELRVMIPLADPYWILTRPTGQQGIVCGTCGGLSWSYHDVEAKHCSACKHFHADIPQREATL